MGAYRDAWEGNKKWREEHEEFKRKLEEDRFKKMAEQGISSFDTSKVPKQKCLPYNSLDPDTATVVWVIVMLVATIFKGNWVIWIVATIVWRMHLAKYK